MIDKVDAENFHDGTDLDDTEREMIQMFRALDEHGKSSALGALKFEYKLTTEAFGDRIAKCDFHWLPNAVFAAKRAQ